MKNKFASAHSAKIKQAAESSLAAAPPLPPLATYMRLLKSARVYWAAFLIGIIATIVATGTDSAFAWAIKPFVDKGLVAHDKWLLEWLPAIIVAAFLIRSVTYFMSNYYISRVGRSVVMDFRQKIFSHLMSLPASFYDQESSGRLLALIMYNTEQVAAASTDALLTIMQEGLSLIGLIVVMFILSWQLALMFMVTAPVVAIVIRYNTKRLRGLSRNVQKSMGEVAHVAEEGIEGYRVIRIFGGEKYEKQKFAHVARNNRNREMKVVATNALGTSIVQLLAALPIALIVYAATLPQLHVTVGGFGAIVAAMLRLLTPMRRLTKINTDIQKGIAGAGSIFAFLDTNPEKDTGTVESPRVRGAIEFRHVNFEYASSQKLVLRDVNFKAKPGQTIALVGRSGGGKTTLVSLLPRFYDATDGQIFIDGVDVHDYKLTELRRQFAFVSQHLTLFNDTVARNIAYGSLENATQEKIEQAAEAAHILDFIRQLPDGFDTMIGENGLLLSGGQRQRIAIARALLKDAPILILDEATSALDNESEFHIQAALLELMRQRTTLVIAHRLSTVERADKIMVMDKGRIIESGTHAELLAAGGVYSRLHRMQFK